MNQKGFGRLEVIGFLAVVALSITIISVLSNQLTTSIPTGERSSGRGSVPITTSGKLENEIKADTYLELEEEIAKKSKEYFSSNTTDETQVVTIAKLVQNDYIPQIYSLNNHEMICTGYVEYHLSKKEAKTYLKCDTEYQTANYTALND